MSLSVGVSSKIIPCCILRVVRVACHRMMVHKSVSSFVFLSLTEWRLRQVECEFRVECQCTVVCQW